jgi:DNA-directed RNA polymerase specialized sigma24 family protein
MDPEDEALERLTLCLERFNEHDRRLILEYYSREHHEKIVLRRQLASDLDCSTAALHTKVFRLKSRLRACMNAGA